MISAAKTEAARPIALISGLLTPRAGELLLRHVRETQIEFQRAQAEIASLGGTVSGNVRIISLESMLARFLPESGVAGPARGPFASLGVTNGVLWAGGGEVVAVAKHFVAVSPYAE